MSSGKTLRYADFHETALTAGDYRLEVKQKAEGRDAAGQPFSEQLASGSSVCFSVLAPRFRLDPESIAEVFPPEHASGSFAGVLPHVRLSRDTLPWERSASTGSGRHPWLALLVFTDAEWRRVTLDGGAGDDKDFTLNRLKDERQSVSFPELVLEDQQHEADRVRVVDVPADLARSVCPRSTELGLCCHARQVSQDEESRAFAQVIAPRALFAQEPGQDFVCALVSVEGRFSDFSRPQPVPADDSKPVRFVLLHRWSFHCTPEPPELHVALRQVTDAGVPPSGYAPAPDDAGWDLSVTSADLALRRPAPDGLPESTRRRLEHGYVAVQHRLRDGSGSAAWYRGPLVPWDAPLDAPSEAPVVRSADELLGFDQELGMFDVGYAAAWELGRTLALADREFALRLYRWKRRHRQELRRSRQALDHWLYPLHPDARHPSPLGEDPDTEWLLSDSLFARVNRLEGIPWRYLVADPSLLPAERPAGDPKRLAPGSLRVFAVDPWWLECLRDGIFSVGRVVAADAAEDRRLRSEPAAIEAPRAFGLLLKAPMVRAWPALVCEAWVPRTGSASGGFEDRHQRLAPMRSARLAPDLLLVLFSVPDDPDVATDALPAAFDFHNPPETLHFGLDHDAAGGGWSRKLRDPASGALLQDGGHDVSVPVPLRDAAQHVLDMAAFAEMVGARIYDPDQAAEPHTLALTLLDAPDRVRVRLTPSTGR